MKADMKKLTEPDLRQLEVPDSNKVVVQYGSLN
jgi:hypothetical protein